MLLTFFLDRQVVDKDGTAVLTYEDIEWFLIQSPEFKAACLAFRKTFKKGWLAGERKKLLKVGRYYYVLTDDPDEDLFMFPVDNVFHNPMRHSLEHSSESMARASSNIMHLNSKIYTDPLMFIKMHLSIQLELSVNFSNHRGDGRYYGHHFSANSDEVTFNSHADNVRVVMIRKPDIGW
jgi:hypothetical protein